MGELIPNAEYRDPAPEDPGPVPPPADVEIVHFAAPDGEALSHALAEAFLDGPIPDWLIPGLRQRWDVFLRYFRLYGDHLLQHGLVYGTPDMAGVACWMDLLGRAAPPEIPDVERKLYEACGEQWIGRFIHLHELFDRVHPRGRPHWYLMLIGVRPAYQGRGIGSALLRYHHDVLDSHGQAAYLESSSPQNRRLYLRTGYTDLGPQALPDGGPHVWPMWREPRRASG